MSESSVPETPSPHAAHAKGLPAIFSQKVGPLPAIAWAGIGLGAYLLYRWYAKKKSGGTPVTATSTANPSTAGVDTSAADYASPTSGYSATDGTELGTLAGTTDLNSTGTPTTNSQWALYAEDQLAGLGTYSPVDITQAIQDFLNGNPLSASEQEIINAALKSYGEPPQGVNSVNLTVPVGGTGALNGTPPIVGGPLPQPAKPAFGTAFIVDDQTDMQPLINAGVPQNQIFYSGTDSQASRAGSDPTLGPPVGLGTLPAGFTGTRVWVGAAGSKSPGTSQDVALQGAMRAQTQQMITTFLQNHGWQ